MKEHPGGFLLYDRSASGGFGSNTIPTNVPSRGSRYRSGPPEYEVLYTGDPEYECIGEEQGEEEASHDRPMRFLEDVSSVSVCVCAESGTSPRR